MALVYGPDRIEQRRSTRRLQHDPLHPGAKEHTHRLAVRMAQKNNRSQALKLLVDILDHTEEFPALPVDFHHQDVWLKMFGSAPGTRFRRDSSYHFEVRFRADEMSESNTETERVLAMIRRIFACEVDLRETNEPLLPRKSMFVGLTFRAQRLFAFYLQKSSCPRYLGTSINSGRHWGTELGLPSALPHIMRSALDPEKYRLAHRLLDRQL